MECQICKKICQTEKINNNTLLAKIELDGSVYCLPCSEIKDWADSVGINKQTQPINQKREELKSISKKKVLCNVITCPKCKNTFSESKCSCGFSNPLFR